MSPSCLPCLPCPPCLILRLPKKYQFFLVLPLSNANNCESKLIATMVKSIEEILWRKPAVENPPPEKISIIHYWPFGSNQSSHSNCFKCVSISGLPSGSVKAMNKSEYLISLSAYSDQLITIDDKWKPQKHLAVYFKSKQQCKSERSTSYKLS